MLLTLTITEITDLLKNESINYYLCSWLHEHISAHFIPYNPERQGIHVWFPGLSVSYPTAHS